MLSSALLFSASSTGKVFRCLRDGGNGSLAMIRGDHSSWKCFSIPPRRAGGNDEEKVRSGQLYTHNPDAVNQYKMDRHISANSL